MLLLNLGTPDGTDYWSMRRYLKEFLSDRRVIEVPRWKWWPILNLIILTVRPGRKGKDYAEIWNNERDEGPLKTITRAQAEKLAAALGMTSASWSTGPCAMPIRRPTAASRAAWTQGCDRILLVPLYPQYAAATTATACDQAFRALMRMRWQPAVRVAPRLPRRSRLYRGARRPRCGAHLAKLDFEPEAHHRLLPRHAAGVSRSGRSLSLPVPEDLAPAARSARLAGRSAGMTTFQSRFGNDPWLQPYTDETVKRLAAEGVKRLALVAPGFLRRLPGDAGGARHGENRHYFIEGGGGEKFAYLPALNDSDEGMRVIEAVVRRELQGWICNSLACQ